MKFATKAAALFLLTAFVSGCQHKAKITPPSTAQAPIAPASTMAKNEPAPQLPPAQLPSVAPAPQPAVTPPPQPKPQKASHHKPKHVTIDASPDTPATPVSTTTPPQNQTTEQASNGTGTNASPIGQLAVAGDATNTPRQNHVKDEIDSTEKGLNGITRQLSKDEQATATQIRTYIAKARDAMKQDDVEGANTLITKAKVLLDELTNP